MVTLAVLDARLAAQLEINGADAHGLSMVCRATDVQELLACARVTRPSVLVVHLDHLGPEPKARLDELVGAIAPQLTFTIYYFEKREVVRALTGMNRRVLRGPITVAALRAQLTSLLVKDALSAPSAGEP